MEFVEQLQAKPAGLLINTTQLSHPHIGVFWLAKILEGYGTLVHRIIMHPIIYLQNCELNHRFMLNWKENYTGSLVVTHLLCAKSTFLNPLFYIAIIATATIYTTHHTQYYNSIAVTP